MITKQPNGLYCRFSTIVDCPTHYNMTQEKFDSIYVEMHEEVNEKTVMALA